ncbi:MAG TPA: TetR/AcrR family transcriptional regulator [Rectinemataceae bacterium]|nr:TetR/AcrR family transcriptional regulator [Rectinemataceae bacterium]
MTGGEASDTKTRILEAAASVFASKGYHDTRVEDIVAASGSSKGGFYFHWPSKEKIFLSLVDTFAELLEQRLLARLAETRGGVERLDAALQVCVETFGKYRALAKIALVQAAGLGRAFDAKRHEVEDRFVAIISENLAAAMADGSIPAVEPEIAARVWMGALDGIVMRWIQTGSPDPEAALPSLRAMLLRSVGVPENRIRTNYKESS